MKAPRLFFLALCAVVLAGCDAVTGPLSDSNSRAPGSLTDLLHAPQGARAAVCHRDAPTDPYQRLYVAEEDLSVHLQHGDERAGGDVLDRNCQPVEAVACPCYAAAELRASFANVAPVPYIFSDTYQYYNEDPRRTELRSTLETEFGLLEEIAAVYITPAGSPDAPLAPICFTQDATLDAMTGRPIYEYETVGLTITEAEACRVEVYAAAADAQTCQGSACDLPYTEEHLDPDFPPYHEDGFRTSRPVLDAMRTEINAVRARLVRPTL